TAFSGKKLRSSLAICAASVLFGSSTNVGRCRRSINQAVVADFPVPVAPSSTTCFSPALIRRSSSSMACGWSPAGSYSLTTLNRPSVRGISLTGRNSEWASTGCSVAKATTPAYELPTTVRKTQRAGEPCSSQPNTSYVEYPNGRQKPAPRRARPSRSSSESRSVRRGGRHQHRPEETRAPSDRVPARSVRPLPAEADARAPQVRGVGVVAAARAGVAGDPAALAPREGRRPGLLPRHRRRRNRTHPVAEHRLVPGHQGPTRAGRLGAGHRRVRAGRAGGAALGGNRAAGHGHNLAHRRRSRPNRVRPAPDARLARNHAHLAGRRGGVG